MSLLQRAAHGGYSAFLAALKPVYLLRLWWRGRREPLYRHAIGERVGAYGDVCTAGWVWVHAVSLGETRAAAALVNALRVVRPDMRLLLTHSTATGRDAGKTLLNPGDSQVWLPYDTPGAVDRFFQQFRPRVGVLMETEVWPNLLRTAERYGVPMVLANARLSEKSRRKGQRLDALLRPAVSSLALVLAQSAEDANRLSSAGAMNVIVSGNLKFDMTPDPILLARGLAWRTACARPVLLAAVTREGEEAMLLATWVRQVASVGVKPLLVIVPRHPQRFDEVATLLRAAGMTLARRSEWADEPPAAACAADAWLGDSMGEMPLYYALAQVALLGGSFAPLGGQNLIEAAACACPVVMGPHTFNFDQAAQQSLAAGASIRAVDMNDGVALALALVADAGRAHAASANALAFAGEHRGAAQRMAERIEALLATREMHAMQ